MKPNLWGAVSAALTICAAPAASAKVMVADYSGVVTFMPGDASLFGPSAGVGSAVDLTFKYDTDVGRTTDGLPDDITLLGGTTVFPAGPSPMRLAWIRIEGVGHGFAPEAEGYLNFDFAADDVFMGASTCPSYCEGVTADFQPVAMPASLTSAFDGAGSGQANFTIIESGRAVFAFVDLQHLSISAAPEPGVWVGLVGGLFGVGVALRRRKAQAPSPI